MDPAIVGALAAVLGSLAGGAATIATAWVTQRTQSRRDLLLGEIRQRERLYAEFSSQPRQGSATHRSPASSLRRARWSASRKAT